MQQTIRRNNFTLIVEDLPQECVETDIIKLVQSYGKVNAITVHRAGLSALAQKPGSASATIEFQVKEHAEAVKNFLESNVIWGKMLSVQLIGPSSPTAANAGLSSAGNGAGKSMRSAQVHISYLTKQLNIIVTEQMIYELFSNFGRVLEVSLKKKCVDTEMSIQNGYGFVHFPLNNEGIDSALRAVEALHQVTINNISYDCSVSNQLRQVLFNTGRLLKKPQQPIMTNVPTPRGVVDLVSPSPRDSMNSLMNSTAAMKISPREALNGLSSGSTRQWLEANDPMPPSNSSPRLSNGYGMSEQSRFMQGNNFNLSVNTSGGYSQGASLNASPRYAMEVGGHLSNTGAPLVYRGQDWKPQTLGMSAHVPTPLHVHPIVTGESNLYPRGLGFPTSKGEMRSNMTPPQYYRTQPDHVFNFGQGGSDSILNSGSVSNQQSSLFPQSDLSVGSNPAADSVSSTAGNSPMFSSSPAEGHFLNNPPGIPHARTGSDLSSSQSSTFLLNEHGGKFLEERSQGSISPFGSDELFQRKPDPAISNHHPVKWI